MPHLYKTLAASTPVGGAGAAPLPAAAPVSRRPVEMPPLYEDIEDVVEASMDAGELDERQVLLWPQLERSESFVAGAPPASPPLLEQTLRKALGVSPAVDAGYLASLIVLAHELAQHANPVEPAAIRVVRERLVQWIEDLRSIGGSAELARAVEQLVERLTAAIASPDRLAAEAVAVASELELVAIGGRTQPTRPAFWK